MNNIDKAAEILMREGMFDAEAHCYAQALADAGLLAPDLPKPDSTPVFNTFAEWFPVPTDPHNPVVWTAPGGTVMVQRLEPGDLTPAEARSVALALLAAAKYLTMEIV